MRSFSHDTPRGTPGQEDRSSDYERAIVELDEGIELIYSPLVAPSYPGPLMPREMTLLCATSAAIALPPETTPGNDEA